ncbi:MAG: hypothetical protein AB1705_24090 [Verrucomicrobiota bacterium]
MALPLMKPDMDIAKSSRHSKIAGDFGEALVLYWLSKYGFECARVDHTGIDLIARRPRANDVLGISVKTRTRSTGAEKMFVKIPADDFDKMENACAAFGCTPYVAVVVDAGAVIRAFITSLTHFLQLFPRTKSGSGWRMSGKHLARYAKDPEVVMFEMHAETKRWWF